jgi:pyruvate kinase
MTPTIITRRLPRLEKSTGIQITATIRPDLDTPPSEKKLRAKIKRLINAGTSHFRLNLSHFKPDDPNTLEKLKLSREEYESRWRELVRHIDAVRAKLQVNVFIMIDTAGPEFRIERACTRRPDGAEEQLPALVKKAEYLLSGDGTPQEPGRPTIYLNMPAGFKSFGPKVNGREISFKDGDCTAEVVSRISSTLLKIRVKHPLNLSGGHNIKANFPGFELEGIHSVSARDRDHLVFFLKIPRTPRAPGEPAPRDEEFITIDYIAQSFVRDAKDISALDITLDTIEGIEKIDRPLIIPKIETAQAVEPETLKEIVKDVLTAAVMVARGDLGSELKRWMVPSKQRQIIRVAHSFLKPVLVATEVYGSMGKYPDDSWQPNRGEVLDLRHALEAGVDGIVFSAETGARKKDPETTVEFAVQQAHLDEKDIEELDLHKAERDKRRERMEYGYDALLGHRARTPQPEDPVPLETLPEFSTMDWACAAVYRANIRRAAGIFPFTVSGNTVRDMVHFLPYRPIVALVDNREPLARLALFAHVHPVLVEQVPDTFDVAELKDLVVAVIAKFGMGNLGGEAFATMPHPVREASGTDTLVRILCDPAPCG